MQLGFTKKQALKSSSKSVSSYSLCKASSQVYPEFLPNKIISFTFSTIDKSVRPNECDKLNRHRGCDYKLKLMKCLLSKINSYILFTMIFLNLLFFSKQITNQQQKKSLIFLSQISKYFNYFLFYLILKRNCLTHQDSSKKISSFFII